MVKAVNLDESPNTLGNPPKKSSSEVVSIINPEDDVEFNIDFSNDTATLDAETVMGCIIELAGTSLTLFPSK